MDSQEDSTVTETLQEWTIVYRAVYYLIKSRWFIK